MTDVTRDNATREMLLSKQSPRAAPFLEVVVIVFGGALTLAWTGLLGWTAGRLIGFW